MMRLFVAVGVPAHAADELDSAVAPLRRSWPALRWTGRDAWHITLAFLGEVDETASARLMPRLERAAARHLCLPVSLDGAGAFPAAARARVLWTGVQGDPRALADLAASVAAGARRAGVPPAEEGRRFQPHLTLARCREPVDARSLVDKPVRLHRHAVDRRRDLPDPQPPAWRPPARPAALRDPGQLAAARGIGCLM